MLFWAMWSHPGLSQDRINCSPEARKGHSQMGWPKLAKQNRLFDTMCCSAGFRLGECPGFGQDRVNFHQNPGRDAAGQADPTWPNRKGYSIPCSIMLGPCWRGAAWRELSRSSGVRGARRWERLSVLCGLCCVFSLSVLLLLLLFPLFAVLLNCPYPDPPVFCLFLSILLSTPVGGGAAAWRGCCRPQPNYSIKFGAQACGGDNDSADQRVVKQHS